MNSNPGRYIAEFKVSYSVGVQTKGRKKGQDKIEEDIITLILLVKDIEEAFVYISNFCLNKNMRLERYDIQPSPGERLFQFNCKLCNELSLDMSPMADKYCSKYCRSKNLFK